MPDEKPYAEGDPARLTWESIEGIGVGAPPREAGHNEAPASQPKEIDR